VTLSLLAGSLLAGLALAVLPLIIHLISKRRARRVRFAAIEFVLRSRKKTARSLRLRQFLLLLVRTLLVAALAFAIAGPFLGRGDDVPAGDAPLVIVVGLDVSASMRAELDGRTAFELARRRAAKKVAGTSADVRFAAVSCGDVVRDLVPEPTFDRALVLAALDQLEPGWGSSDLVACAARAAELALRPEGEGAREVAIVSDLAAHAFAGVASARADGVRVEWVPATDEKEPPPNHGFTALSLERTAAQGEGVEVQFTVSRFGGVPAEVPVDLIVDGQRVSRVTVPLTDGAREQRTLAHSFAVEDERRAAEARVVLPDDALDFDNEVRLPVTLAPPVSVLIVDGAPQPVPFRDEVYYLSSALTQKKAGEATLRTQVLGPAEVDAGRLAGARVVVLANVARLEAMAAAALADFVEAGGGLLVTSGDQMDIEWYNTHLARLLPGRLRGAKGQALLEDAQVAAVLGLAGFSSQHPVFRGIVADDAAGLVGLGRVRTHTTMLLEPDATADRAVLMRFTNEAPALLERQVGAGRVMLLATTIDRDWSDLAIRPGFLPLAQQMVLHLAGALGEGRSPLVTVGQSRMLVLPRGAARLEVRAPSGDRRTVSPAPGTTPRADGSVLAPFDEVDEPGLYRVFVQFEGGDDKELLRQRFTALPDAGESDLRRADDETLVAAVPKGATATGGSHRDDEVPLWPWLLLGVIGLVLFESWVLRRASV